MAGMPQGGKRGRGRYRPLSDINVTPMVDVMLVLLIIFMVTAPLMSSSVNVDLPKVNATPINQDNEPLQVSVNAQGQVYLMDETIELPALVSKLQEIAKDQKDRRIFVRGDRGNTYGRMMEVMGTIIQGGFTKVSLLTEQVGPTPVGAMPPGSTSPGTPPPGPTSATPAANPGPARAPAATPAAPAPTSSDAARRQGRG